jgi:hypothetical protein
MQDPAKGEHMKRVTAMWLGFAAVGALLVVSGGRHPVSAQVACGESVSNESRVMTSDLDCSSALGPITLTNSKLDMNGHTIDCGLTAIDGVVLAGSGSQLKNGVVQYCYRGVRLQDAGKHKVTGVLSRDNGYCGFWVDSGAGGNKFTNTAAVRAEFYGYYLPFTSDNSTFTNASAVGNGHEGFLIRGNGNKLMTCTSYHNAVGGTLAYAGFDITGDGNKVSNSAHLGNGSDGGGFWISGNGNEVTGCFAGQTGLEAFFLWGTGNKGSKNIAMGADAVAFRLQGTEPQLKKSVAVATNGWGVWMSYVTDGSVKKVQVVSSGAEGVLLSAGGTGTAVQSSVVMDSGAEGIRNSNASPASGLTVKKNVVVGSDVNGGGADDIADGDGSCTGDTWLKNVFGSATPGCVQ